MGDANHGMAGVDPLQNEILWARRPFGNDVGLGTYASPRWHRFVARAETEIVVACNRRLPLESPVFPEVPEGGHPCRSCATASQR